VEVIIFLNENYYYNVVKELEYKKRKEDSMVEKTTHIRMLEEEQIKEIKNELKKEIGDGPDAVEDIENALDSRLSDLEDVIDIYNLKRTKVRR